MCLSCARFKDHTWKLKCKLNPLPIPSRPMEIVQLDIMGPLPTSELGNKYILVITCLLTKYPECKALKDKLARTVASVFMDSFLCRYMCPKVISTDAGTEFTVALTTQ